MRVKFLQKVQNYVTSRSMKSGIIWVGALTLIVGALVYVPQAVTVSNSVNGRELPIYCVQTDKKQVALTFDAAWGVR